MSAIKNLINHIRTGHLVKCELTAEDEMAIDLARHGLLLRQQTHNLAPLLPPREESDQVPIDNVIWAVAHSTDLTTLEKIPSRLDADDEKFVRAWIDRAESYYQDGRKTYMKAVEQGATCHINRYIEDRALAHRHRTQSAAAAPAVQTADKEELSASTGRPPARVDAWSSEETVVARPLPEGQPAETGCPDVEAPRTVDQEDHHGGDDEEQQPARPASQSEPSKSARKKHFKLRTMMACLGKKTKRFVVNFRDSTV